MNRFLLKQQLADFFSEDIGYGDITSDAIFKDEQGEGVFVAKGPGVFSGEEIINAVKELYPELGFTLFVRDGESFSAGKTLLKVKGPVTCILSTERVILNLVQRLSGIAAMTHEAVSRTAGTRVKISDTRKTTPGLRMLEKYAVRCGGGINHRFGLDDAFLIKDNHIARAGSVTTAIKKAKQAGGHMVKIEVEVENTAQVKEAVAAEADVIMLDNCGPQQAADWCKMIPSHITVEISGGVTISQIEAFTQTGADVISIGALTHSAGSVDISLDILVKERTSYV
ncbi:carboxylating nicotinate-nucleotide diphosphorylase [Salipaludibacillus sp. CUR1]|uniref:carboxylating nicotinate-nucleotide diphosphorylase n=1 Tax=Salipaludibacillus sp. CUR1 TaxID=2820003 RepID=UPI001E54BF5C|nr:carboxylating nicotinate-nucleotide diphosphorylase [Salipaludibacillus sp. CUR1]MCE7793691.1 carboxylating nicotinate-nucleotide diphosphorylase [Salipaludibacillus sp. CUR1]